MLVALAALTSSVPGGLALARSSSKSGASQKLAAVPAGFVGVDVDGPMFASGIPGTPLNFPAQLKSMVASGVESIRTAFDWAAAEPYQNWQQVPVADENLYTNVNGSPISFVHTDEVVQDAARLHVTVLPTILYAPGWDARSNPGGVSIPQRVAPYAAYAAALVNRYGTRGTFWSQHPGLPKVPITMWQIWNEPNISYYWTQPFAKGYVSLLRAAHASIKRADPHAQVVLAALTNFAARAIGQIYRVGHVRGLFDIAAVNGFTRTPANVILYLHFIRGAMSHFQDGHKPLLATEMSWPSAQGKTFQHYDFNTTQAGQARDISQLLPMIGQQRTSLHLIGFYYYTWVGNESPATANRAFDYAGLLRFVNGKVSGKPALGAFRAGALALERCRKRGSVATRCARPAG